MNIYTQKEVEELKPNRIQYTIKEACYMLNCGEDSLRNWANLADVSLYQMFGKGKLYIDHDDLVEIQQKGKMFESFIGEVYGNC